MNRLFIKFNDGNVHETSELKMNHAEGIASYTAEHDNDERQVEISSIDCILSEMPVDKENMRVEDADLAQG